MVWGRVHPRVGESDVRRHGAGGGVGPGWGGQMYADMELAVVWVHIRCTY